MADAELKSVDDPRDPYLKLRRVECLRYASIHKLPLERFNQQSPAREMQAALRELGIPVQPVTPPLGSDQPAVYDGRHLADRPPQNNSAVVEQYAEFQKPAEPEPPAAKSFDEMNMNEMRAACRELGIKMERTDNMKSLRAKLKAHNGENPPQ